MKGGVNNAWKYSLESNFNDIEKKIDRCSGGLHNCVPSLQGKINNHIVKPPEFVQLAY